MAKQGQKSVVQALQDALWHFAVKSRKMASPVLQPFGRASEPTTVNDVELKALRSKLERIRATLRAAESLSVTDHSIRLWLTELGDLEYRAEDVLEELEYESRRADHLEELKLELLSTATTRKRKREVELLFSAAPASRLRRKIDDIWARYQDIASDRKVLRLRPGDGVARPVISALVPSSSLPKGQLHGRERDVEKVVELLLRQSQPDDWSDECVHAVVPIVGMAGVGKTALVQHVCRKEVVAAHFDLTLWVWVSQEFDLVNLTAKIVEEITKSRPESRELNTLHSIMVERLAGKKCLIILDDVWDDNPNHWDSLKAPLNCCALGSRVIVTTRSKKVATMVSPKVHRLSCLSDDNCWRVCRRRALHDRNVNIGEELVRIGKNIAKMCKGLPLAAEAAGSALSTSISEKHWNEVLESYLWTDNEVLNQILPALKMSYDHLSLPLKRCFTFCSLFPKGFVFQKDVLVQLWIAQGFVDVEGKSRPEDIGGGYLNDLVLRCFFQPSPSHDDSEEKFVMHDLYQELAQFVSGNEYRMIEYHMLTKVDERARHLSLVPEESDPDKDIYFNSICGHDLRTFLIVGRMEQKPGEIPFRIKMPCELIIVFECLRALDLSNTSIMELPKSIGSLIHLRYLSLENTRIQFLPESIGALLHLQTIKLNHCSSLTQLPQGTKLLMNLRCLELPHSNIQMPSGLGVLTSLQKLPLFVVGNEHGGCGVEELNELVNLRGHLHIVGLNNLDAAQAAKGNLQNKKGLQKLTLEWSGMCLNRTHSDIKESAEIGIASCISEQDDVVLEYFRPNFLLEELIVKGFKGFQFATWLGMRDFCRLVSIELKDCQNCQTLPPLGCLLSLKHVSIESMPSVKHVGSEFCGNVTGSSEVCDVFPVLETLKFRDMEAWEEWSGVEDGFFLELKHLSIWRCCKLKELPKFTSKPKMRIHHCEKLPQWTPCKKTWDLLGYRESTSELSYACSAEGDVSILEASCST